MKRWNIKPLMDAKGIENASQLAKFARLSPPVAQRVIDGEPLERIEVATLEALADAFGLSKRWWKLIG